MVNVLHVVVVVIVVAVVSSASVERGCHSVLPEVSNWSGMGNHLYNTRSRPSKAVITNNKTFVSDLFINDESVKVSNPTFEKKSRLLTISCLITKNDE